MKPKTSFLDLISASYSVSGSDADWFAQVLEMLRPSIDRGYGLYGWFQNAHHLDRVTAADLHFHSACPDEVRAFALDVYCNIRHSPEYARVVADLLLAYPAASLSSIVPHALWNHATQRFFDLAKAFSGRRVLRSTSGAASPVWESRRTTYESALPKLLALGPVRDLLGLQAYDPSGAGCNIVGISPRLVRLPRNELVYLQRASAHVAAGLRLRRRLQKVSNVLDAAHVIFDADGHLQHVENLAAIPAVVALADTQRLLNRPAFEHGIEMWTALVAGEWSMVRYEDRDRRRFFVAYPNAPELREHRRLTPREVQVVSYSSLGHSNKMIAYELGLGEHAIGEHLRRAAKKLGVSRRIELLKIARALRELPQPHEGAPGDDAKRTEGGSRLQDNASEVGAGAGLTASERSVVQLAYDGLSDRDIARARGTSARTVANQLRSAFRRLGIGSRVELVRRLLISR